MQFGAHLQLPSLRGCEVSLCSPWPLRYHNWGKKLADARFDLTHRLTLVDCCAIRLGRREYSLLERGYVCGSYAYVNDEDGSFVLMRLSPRGNPQPKPNSTDPEFGRHPFEVPQGEIRPDFRIRFEPVIGTTEHKLTSVYCSSDENFDEMIEKWKSEVHFLRRTLPPPGEARIVPILGSEWTSHRKRYEQGCHEQWQPFVPIVWQSRRGQNELIPLERAATPDWGDEGSPPEQSPVPKGQSELLAYLPAEAEVREHGVIENDAEERLRLWVVKALTSAEDFGLPQVAIPIEPTAMRGSCPGIKNPSRVTTILTRAVEGFVAESGVVHRVFMICDTATTKAAMEKELASRWGALSKLAHLSMSQATYGGPEVDGGDLILEEKDASMLLANLSLEAERVGLDARRGRLGAASSADWLTVALHADSPFAKPNDVPLDLCDTNNLTYEEEEEGSLQELPSMTIPSKDAVGALAQNSIILQSAHPIPRVRLQQESRSKKPPLNTGGSYSAALSDSQVDGESLRKKFEDLDVDDSDTISVAELRRLYVESERFGLVISQREAQTMIEQVAGPGSTRLDFDQFSILMLRLAKR